MVSASITRPITPGGPKGPSDRFAYVDRCVDSLRGMHRRASHGVGFDAADTDRTRRRFNYILGAFAGADRHLPYMTLQRIREMCRAHDRNSALLSGLLNRALDNIFGANFSFRPTTGEEDLDHQVAEYIDGRMLAENADTAGVHTFPEIARTSLRGVWVDGDSLLVHQPDGSVMGIEADQVESPKGLPPGGETRRIVLGVELSPVNRPVAFWVRQRATHGDYGMIRPEATSKPVPTADCQFAAHRTRFSQTRGFPVLAPALSLYDRLDSYLDNETLIAELQSMLGFQITRDATEEGPDGVSDNPETETNDVFDQLQRFEPGMIFDLRKNPGHKIAAIAADRPGTNFEPYTIMVCRIVGASVGFPLELMLLDFSKTSWSSARVGLAEARRTFKYWQSFADHAICRPWYRRQIDRGIASGELPARPECYKHASIWPAWAYVNPQQEAAGNGLQIAMGAKSISEVIRETGGNPREVMTELGGDIAFLKGLGITPNFGGPSAPREKADQDVADAERTGGPGGKADEGSDEEEGNE